MESGQLSTHLPSELLTVYFYSDCGSMRRSGFTQHNNRCQCNANFCRSTNFVCQNATAPDFRQRLTKQLMEHGVRQLSIHLLGTTLYTFTPTAGQCANPFSVNITIVANVTPTFAEYQLRFVRMQQHRVQQLLMKQLMEHGARQLSIHLRLEQLYIRLLRQLVNVQIRFQSA